MRHSLHSLLLIFGLTLLTMGFTCGKEEIKPTYEFSEKFSLTPYKKLYTISDTIKLQFKTADKSLFDNITSKRIATDTTFFNLGFQYVQQYPFLLTNYDTLAYVLTLSGINRGLQIYNSFNSITVNTGCINSTSYLAELAFVPKKAGIYTLYLPSAETQSCASKKVRFPYSTLSFVYDLSDCNKDVYLSIPEAYRKDSKYIENLIDTKKVFAFKVE